MWTSSAAGKNADKSYACPHCIGSGCATTWVYEKLPTATTANDSWNEPQPLPTGYRRHNNKRCYYCRGTGRVHEEGRE